MKINQISIFVFFCYLALLPASLFGLLPKVEQELARLKAKSKIGIKPIVTKPTTA